MKRNPMPAAIVDAFTHTAGHGNRAGVVLDAKSLDEATMRAAARAVAASETAFDLAPSPGVDVHLRYFTPATEIDFCGHATVATFHRLAETGRLAAPGTYVLETAAGRLEVELEPVEHGCRVWIATPRSPWQASPIEPPEIMRLLGGAPRMLDPVLPVQRSGLKIFVPIARRDDLWALAPAWDDLAGAGLAHGVHGFFAFTRDAAEPGHVVQSRFYAPAVGIREDPVTGSANGPLAEYLALHGVMVLPAAGGRARARAEQGDAMGKPGRIDLEVEGAPGRVERARVGGVAVTVMEGTLFPS
jgi:PhzF family phenazine biosynthesis protein